MKRITLIAVIFLSTWVLYAQENTVFYKHELRASFGPSLVSGIWLQSGMFYRNFSVAYFYRPVRWLWVGGNFVNIFGDKIYYHWREYSVDGSFEDFSKSKIKYCAVIAPEIKYSYFYKKEVLLYGAISGGIAWEDGYDEAKKKYPRTLPYFHLTYLGLSYKFGKNENIFLGGEFGIGMKGLISMHGGYRF